MNCVGGMRGGGLRPKRKKIKYTPMFSSLSKITLNMNRAKPQIRGPETTRLRPPCPWNLHLDTTFIDYLYLTAPPFVLPAPNQLPPPECPHNTWV